MITKQQLEKAYSYQEYKQLLVALLAQGKTTGHDQSEIMISYAKLNVQRMDRVEKTMQFTETLKESIMKIRRPFIWLVLTEGWCGDTAQSVPVFDAISHLTPHIDLKLLLRDDNPDVIGQFLTNGARSIPKLICLERESLKEAFIWGPRPAALQQQVVQLVKEKVPPEEKGLIVQKWYNADKTISIQEEMRQLADTHMQG